MDDTDPLTGTFRCTKRLRTPTKKIAPDTPLVVTQRRKGAGTGPRTLFYATEHDEAIEKCKGAAEWRVAMPSSGVQCDCGGRMYAIFASLEAATNFLKRLRNPPPPKPKRVDKRLNRRRDRKKRVVCDSQDVEILNDTDSVMKLLDDENEFALVLGDVPIDIGITESVATADDLACDEELDGVDWDTPAPPTRVLAVSPLTLPDASREPHTQVSLLPRSWPSGPTGSVEQGGLLCQPSRVVIRCVGQVLQTPFKKTVLHTKPFELPGRSIAFSMPGAPKRHQRGANRIAEHSPTAMARATLFSRFDSALLESANTGFFVSELF